ncbi:MAG: LacI family DNA-binding transcriptional regulator [Oscillospiraceae bacterium]|nr:LacI family DNA-binding transcriptional regulator [Oscillospiraceae bacterium]
MGKKVTIQDIADALGISRNTVSKAINNSEGLADATREKILQKAVEMGYKQFSYLSALASSERNAAESTKSRQGFCGEIALFTTTFLTNSHFASLMLDSFQREISQLGYTLNTHRITPENRETLTLPITFSKERTSAIICIEMFDQTYDEMVCALGLPVLFVDGPVKIRGDTLSADQLYMDNTSGILALVNSMLSKGIRHIGFIGDYQHCQSFFERYMAYRGAMLMAGQPVEERWCVKGITAEEIAEQLTALKELPELFICANDFVACDAMRVLCAQGWRVPEDVRISGFDDAPESRNAMPPLTTVHIHTQIMAFSAVHLLMSRINQPSLDYRTIYTETELIWRASTEF